MALEEFNIDKFGLDCCCSEQNIPANYYYKNGIHDGLKEPWHNFTWCNPPFNQCKKWVEKAHKEHKEKNISVAMLLPARTETGYWSDFILDDTGGTNKPNVKVKFLRKGYKFLNKENQEMGIFKNALALVFLKGGNKE